MVQPRNKENKLTERSFFDYLPKDKLAEIVKRIPTIVIPKDTVIFRQGDPADCFYVIRSGKIKAVRKNEEGVETDLGVLGPGDGFGEYALLTGTPRTASAVTLEETVVSALPKEQFDQILKDYPMVALSLSKNMIKMILQDWGKLEKETKEHYQAPRITWFDFVLIFGVTIICGLLFNFANPQGLRLTQKSWSEDPIATITPVMANQKYNQGEVLFIDARPSSFYAQEHIKGALSLPADLFDIAYLMEREQIDRAHEIVVYGRTISSLYDEQVAAKLRLRGHTNVSILAGDLSTWKKKGYPTAP
ncbi:MAG TPA: cyclic nucleotide-binding domain-containing protein [Thermodesulfobacteriota bacterium]|nr:cyclic nucleotide-binding domain-containing protein [Thermodesulfobacteriota bacterium]